ncbi:S24 family peptidase [Neisseria sp. Ec49-e6-T10]|uniref:S24 family peptidase n=1 Tax=Neisseria sp. Ec49-e6-T10 TaxID=3140744 RepID=UPI003EB8B399
MKTIADVRRQNLLILIDEYGTVQKLASVLDKSPSQVSQNKTGFRDIGNTLAREIEVKTGKQNGWMDTDHSSDHDTFPRPATDENFAFIPQYTARAECGKGEENPHVEIKRHLAFARDWLILMGLKEEMLEVIYAEGDSMFPTISAGDILLVDSSQREPIEGKVFAIHRHGNGDVVKRIARDREGGWIYISDNNNKSLYQDMFPLEDDYIIGRVVWQGGQGGLL